MKKTYVSIETEIDVLGIETPLIIKWYNDKEYVVERVIHTSRKNSELLEYIVLIHGQQKKLFKEKDRWYVEASS